MKRGNPRIKSEHCCQCFCCGVFFIHNSFDCKLYKCFLRFRQYTHRCTFSRVRLFSITECPATLSIITSLSAHDRSTTCQKTKLPAEAKTRVPRVTGREKIHPTAFENRKRAFNNQQTNRPSQDHPHSRSNVCF